MELVERLLADSRWDNDCLIWTGSTNSGGYGQFKLHGQHWTTHVASWTAHHGPPDGWVLHTCDNRVCFNPAHLWLGTAQDNSTDMKTKGRSRGGRPPRSTCIRDHSLSGDNLYITPDGRPQCRTCQRERYRRWYYAHR